MSNLMEKEPRNTRKTQKNDFMEKLLDGVEVEWLPLGDVTQYEQPTD